jgi:hypothetical protein
MCKENDAVLYICKECRLEDLDLHWKRVIELGGYFPRCVDWENMDGSDMGKGYCDKCKGRDYQVVLWLEEYAKEKRDMMIEEIKEIFSRPSQMSRCKCKICLRKRHSISGNSFRLKTYSEEIWTSMGNNIDHMAM